MRAVAWAGGAAVVGALAVLAAAGISGATAVLVTVGALLAMIALGGLMGGRHTPDVPPAARPGAAPVPPTAPEPGGVAPGTPGERAEGAEGGG